MGGHQGPSTQGLQKIFVLKALWECRNVFKIWEQSKKASWKEEGEELMNHSSSQLWYFAPQRWEVQDQAAALSWRSCSTSAAGNSREQPRNSPVGWWGATRGDSLGVIWSCTSPLKTAAGKRIWEDMRKVSAKKKKNRLSPPPLWKRKKPTWHLRNKLLKCEIMQQGKLSQRIRNWFNRHKLTAAWFVQIAACWEGERSTALESWAQAVPGKRCGKQKFFYW